MSPFSEFSNFFVYYSIFLSQSKFQETSTQKQSFNINSLFSCLFNQLDQISCNINSIDFVFLIFFTKKAFNHNFRCQPYSIIKQKVFIIGLLSLFHQFILFFQHLQRLITDSNHLWDQAFNEIKIKGLIQNFSLLFPFIIFTRYKRPANNSLNSSQKHTFFVIDIHLLARNKIFNQINIRQINCNRIKHIHDNNIHFREIFLSKPVRIIRSTSHIINLKIRRFEEIIIHLQHFIPPFPKSLSLPFHHLFGRNKQFIPNPQQQAQNCSKSIKIQHELKKKQQQGVPPKKIIILMVPEKEFKYSSVEPVQLHQLIRSLVLASKTSKPYFPAPWSKKLCEENGLQCNEDVFFNMMSNVVDYKLEEMMSTIKENKASAAASKKQAKQMVLKTSDVEKYFDGVDFQLNRPRIYPQFQVNDNSDDAVMPISEEDEIQKKL